MKSIFKVEEYREGASGTNNAAIGKVCVTTHAAFRLKDVRVPDLQALGAASHLCTSIGQFSCVLPKLLLDFHFVVF